MQQKYRLFLDDETARPTLANVSAVRPIEILTDLYHLATRTAPYLILSTPAEKRVNDWLATYVTRPDINVASDDDIMWVDAFPPFEPYITPSDTSMSHS